MTQHDWTSRKFNQANPTLPYLETNYLATAIGDFRSISPSISIKKEIRIMNSSQRRLEHEDWSQEPDRSEWEKQNTEANIKMCLSTCNM